MIVPVARLSLRSMARPMAARSFSAAALLRNKEVEVPKTAQTLADVRGPETLIGPGAKQGTVPTDLEQATGLERLELLGIREGIDVFDRRPLDASRKGTIADPILVDSYENYRYVGCTGSPAGSHVVQWLKPTDTKPARCWECGSVYKINNLSVPIEGDDGHHH
ncbi:uncharacterized protein SAPINGB_P000162 [Magnusiomyces paraingens]|uniref:Cytochrome c oxidase subunit 4, mitochondrial n=1 Tax=Magnusiomyces paraingens TaxID=2606893 RepID=A0A5E8B4K5_9ASCO|nr:uncharacterized protein SAPINGB_P000162 [Saprochaete ingens]VVT43820.1 unnamed protein product [Saprochaete ingens]